MRGAKSANGEERMAELFASPMPDGKAMLYLVDVSEQKALETKFAQSQKMQAVGQLAGGVAHDFNNLLTVIIGNCEFLLMRHQAGDPSFKEINEVHQNALRAAALVSQLLAFSRKQTMQPKVLALGDVIGELAQMLRRLVGEGITLNVEREPDLWAGACRRGAAGQRHHQSGGQCPRRHARRAAPSPSAPPTKRVDAASALGTAIMPAGDYVRIEVTDTGTGMSKEIQSKIFDPFFTTKPVGQGTGLGLATVYGIVKQSGGFITVDSEAGHAAPASTSICRAASVEAADAAPRGSRARGGARRHRPGHDPAGGRRRSGAQLRGAGPAHARLSMCWKPAAARKRWRSSRAATPRST